MFGASFFVLAKAEACLKLMRSCQPTSGQSNSSAIVNAQLYRRRRIYHHRCENYPKRVASKRSSSWDIIHFQVLLSGEWTGYHHQPPNGRQCAGSVPVSCVYVCIQKWILWQLLSRALLCVVAPLSLHESFCLSFCLRKCHASCRATLIASVIKDHFVVCAALLMQSNKTLSCCGADAFPFKNPSVVILQRTL